MISLKHQAGPLGTSLVVYIGRTRWRLKFGRFRLGWRRNEGVGTLALPILILHWITRNKGAPD